MTARMSGKIRFSCVEFCRKDHLSRLRSAMPERRAGGIRFLIHTMRGAVRRCLVVARAYRAPDGDGDIIVLVQIIRPSEEERS